MKKAILPLIWSIVPLLIGIGLPYFELPGRVRLINPLWAVLYGGGLWMLDKLALLRIQSALSLLGVVVWPVAVSAGLYWLGRRLEQTKNLRIQSICLCLLGISFLCVVELQRSLQPPLSHVPTFYKMLFVIW